MKRFFYGISIFIFLCVLSAGYYGTYRMAQSRAGEGKILELGLDGDTVRAETVSGGEPDGNSQYGLFWLKEKDGYVVVYRQDQKTVYEITSIAVKLLPEKVKKEIREGKYIKTRAELYGFLENYSS